MYTLLAMSASQPSLSGNSQIDGGTATIVAAIVAAVVSIFTCIITFRHNNRIIREMRQGDLRKQLRSALEELLIPVSNLLMNMKGLFDVFRAGKPAGFRTLSYLIDPETYRVEGSDQNVVLSASDRALLKEILVISDQLETLLAEKGGLIDDPVLHAPYAPDPSVTDVDPEKLDGLGLFAIARIHFRMMRMADRGLLRGDPARYSQFVYPRALNDAVAAAIEKVKAQLRSLSR